MSNRSNNDGKIVTAGLLGFGGCWLVSAVLGLATTVLVVWGLWEAIHWLQRH
jgi:hypothetical protein